MMKIEIETIGWISTPFKDLKNMPIQPAGAVGINGEVTVFDEYSDGLRDLESFSHIYLLYHLHKAFRTSMLVVPYMDSDERGVFATRSPLRPSHIGLSIVELVSVKGNILEVHGIDVIDGTPLLDIKPYVPEFDLRPDASSGWLANLRRDVKKVRSDDRFI